MDANGRLYYRTAKQEDIETVFNVLQLGIDPIIEEDDNLKNHRPLSQIIIGPYIGPYIEILQGPYKPKTIGGRDAQSHEDLSMIIAEDGCLKVYKNHTLGDWELPWSGRRFKILLTK